MQDTSHRVLGFSLNSGPRDKSFKLIELAFLQVLPLARGLRSKLFFVSLGFEGEIEAKLHSIYRRYDVKGLGIGPSVTTPAIGASILAQMNGASGTGALDRFDCVSLLDCTAGTQILDLVRAGAFRPGLVHCADKDAFESWSSVRAHLIAMGYASVGELEGAELLIDAPLFEATDARPTIATFDVFDTLIARRCWEPWRIFEKVGEIIGVADFVQQRREAESRVLDKKYVFDDIYDELMLHYGWSVDRRHEVQALELSCEVDAAIPITENLSRVRDGDLLVSDMYLSEAAIRSLLVKAGLTATVGLFVESHGKSSGRVWPIIDAQYRISSHLGDNRHADVAAPAHFGIVANLTQSSDPNIVEQTLLQAGLRNLSLLCREARLRSWHADPKIRALQTIQASLNFPLLILASVFLARRATTLESTSLAFCSRDCNLWLPLFNLIQAKMGLRIETSYFLTSRISRTKGSDAYLQYARDHLRPGTLVVDLCGTGWSMANLAERLGTKACNLFLVDHCPPLDIFERAKETPKTCVVHTLFDKRPKANNIVLELANMADHGMVVDMRAVGAAHVPVLAPIDLSDAEIAAVQAQRTCFLASVDLIQHHALQEVFDLDDASISFLCASLYEYMSNQADSFQVFAENFLTENDKIVRALVT